MSSTSWEIGLSGDWSSARNWLSGVPTNSTDATIAAVGSYTVSIGEEVASAKSLTLDDAAATLQEAPNASSELDLADDLTILAGAAILAGDSVVDGEIFVIGANSLLSVSGSLHTGGTIEIASGAMLQLANPAGLGQDPVELVENGAAGNAELLATESGTFEGALTVNAFDAPVIIAAATGKTLTLGNGDWSITQSASPIQFGAAGDAGAIVWHTATPASTNFCTLDVAYGTLKGGDANFDELFTLALSVGVEAGAKLDLGGASIGVLDLYGAGVVTSSSGAPTLSLTTNAVTSQPNFDGEIVAAQLSGSLSLDLQTANNEFTEFVFTGSNNYSGITTVEDKVTLVIGDADLGFVGVSGSGVSGSLGKGAVVLKGASDLEFHRTDAVTVANQVQGTGGVEYFAGAYTVDHANPYSGGTAIENSGVYSTNLSGSIGGGQLALDQGEFAATSSMTVANALSLFDSATFAASAGKTLTLATASNWEIDGNLVFGDATHTGTVVWDAGSGGIFDPGAETLEVRDGGLVDGDGTLSNSELSQFQSVTVDASAVLQLKGTFAEFKALLGDGVIRVSGTPTLNLESGDFGGVFSGACNLQLEGGTLLTGDSTSVKLVQFLPGSTLALGDGGATGSIGSARMIFDSGKLIIDHSNAFALTNALVSNGVVAQYGDGVTTATNLGSFTGVFQVAAGELDVNNTASHAKGVDLEGGLFATTANVTLGGALTTGGNVTIAAANQTTQTLDFSSWSFDASSLTFGDAGHAGVINWHTPAAGTGIDPGDVYSVSIDAGTLKASDANLTELLVNATQTTIAAGATLDLGVQGIGVGIGNLQGSGSITGVAGTVLQIANGEFAGAIKGALTVEVARALEITGANTFTGDYDLTIDSSLTLGHAAKQDVLFLGDATLTFTLGNAYTGTVQNFDGASGTMDFEGINFADASEHFANGLLTISDGAHTEKTKLAGTFSDQSFALSDDRHGGVNVNYTGVA